MKTKVFELEISQMITNFVGKEQKFTIPVLPAYAVDYAILYINGLGSPIDNTNVTIRADMLIWKFDGTTSYAIDQNDTCRLEIRYYGIRDYKLLFPRVLAADPNRAIRLGLYYEEMETCFDNSAWLSFMLMAGAIFEHLLYFKMNGSRHTLSSLNNDASHRRLISRPEHAIIDKTREYRNVIHCNRLHEQYVERKDALDARSLIERLILRL